MHPQLVQDVFEVPLFFADSSSSSSSSSSSRGHRWKPSQLGRLGRRFDEKRDSGGRVTSTSPPLTPTKPMMVVRLKKAHRHHRVIIIVVKIIAFYLIENTHAPFFTHQTLSSSRVKPLKTFWSLSLSLCVCVCARARVVGESRGNVYRHRFGFQSGSQDLNVFFFFFFTKTLNKKP